MFRLAVISDLHADLPMLEAGLALTRALGCDRVVCAGDLVDGGVHDNQGLIGVIEQGCDNLIVSDASGQMDQEDAPSSGFLNVVSRSNSVLQARLRDVQLVQQPVAHGGFAGQARVFNGALQPFGIREPAHGQRGGGQPHQLQEAGGGQRRGAVQAHGAEGQWSWLQWGPCTCPWATTGMDTVRPRPGAAVFAAAWL